MKKSVLITSLCVFLSSCEQHNEIKNDRSQNKQLDTNKQTERTSVKNRSNKSQDTAYSYYRSDSNMLESVSLDSDLQRRILVDLEIDRRLSESTRNLQVFVNGGVVTITGVVRTEIEKWRIGDRVRQTSGVRSVNNQLRVSDEFGFFSYPVPLAHNDTSENQQLLAEYADSNKNDQDEAMEDRVQQTLRNDQNLGVNARNIQVDVVNGIITLKGNVHTQKDKIMIENRVRKIAGANQINNQLATAHEQYAD